MPVTRNYVFFMFFSPSLIYLDQYHSRKAFLIGSAREFSCEVEQTGGTGGLSRKACRHSAVGSSFILYHKIFMRPIAPH